MTGRKLWMSPGWMALGGLVCGQTLAAEDRPARDEAVAQCREMKTDAERLACYDQLFGAPEAQSAPLLKETASAAEPAQAEPMLMTESRWELLPEKKRGAFRLTPY